VIEKTRREELWGVGFSPATPPMVAGVDDVASRRGGIVWWCGCGPCKKEGSV